jgi:Tol biopolymer transport system component
VRRLLPLLVVIAAACTSAPVTAPGTTAAPSTSGAGPASTPAPDASLTTLPTSRPGVRATAAEAIPATFRYVAVDTALADGFRTRLWLVDLTARRAPIVVAEWDGPAAPVGDHSVSADGTRVLLSAAGTRSRVALYLLRVETGDVRVLFEDPATIPLSPRLSPDGQRYAFSRYPAEGGSDLGIWSGAASGGDARRIADPSSASNVPALPLAWSVDGAWLAFSRDVDIDRTEVRLAPRDGGPEIAVGLGDRVAWRRSAPELLVGVLVPPSSRAYTFDLRTGKTVDVVKIDKLFVTSLQWHPTQDRFVYVESESAGREASGGIWLRNADGSGAQRLDTVRSAFAPEWSADGTLLTGLAGGDDALVPVVDLQSGKRLSVLCRRGGTPPGSCL